jgi:uncharacterized protein YqgV (UPF0045/DUF77 family)
MIVEIQCLPSPPGHAGRRWAHVEAAIDVVRSSGLRYEVGPLGTSVEGEPDEVWALVRRAHEACLASGADGLVSVIKVEQSRDQGAQPTIAGLVEPYR